MNFVTIKYRIKDSTSRKHLDRMARSVNYVFNYCNEASYKSLRYNSKWLSEYDLCKLTAGTSKELGLSSTTIQETCKEYVNKRVQAKKAKLKWRTKKSLGWIPFKWNGIGDVSNGQLVYLKHKFSFWNSRALPGPIRCGSFNQDAKGNWYINLTCEDLVYTYKKTGKSVGVDLGLKTVASYSDGSKYEGLRSYRSLEKKLSIAQRAGKKKQVKNISRKAANQRKDSLHKETTRLIKEYDTIVVGDVSSKKLMKTRMAKSVSDASWGMYKSFLEYKAIRFGKEVLVVKENWTTVTCSECLNRTFPKSGLSSLSVREWACSVCGTVHDRDTNASRNILRIGHDTLIKGAGLTGDANDTKAELHSVIWERKDE
jgi:putative transposase